MSHKNHISTVVYLFTNTIFTLSRYRVNITAENNRWALSAIVSRSRAQVPCLVTVIIVHCIGYMVTSNNRFIMHITWYSPLIAYLGRHNPLIQFSDQKHCFYQIPYRKPRVNEEIIDRFGYFVGNGDGGEGFWSRFLCGFMSHTQIIVHFCALFDRKLSSRRVGYKIVKLFWSVVVLPCCRMKIFA